DLAQTELRLRDVGSRHAPLIGLAGRIGTLGPELGSHPGPLSFLGMWPFYELSGGSAWSMEAAAPALDTIAIALALRLVSPRGGPGLVCGTAVVLALLLRGYGTERLLDPWNPHLPVLWWLVFVLAIWAVVCDDLPMLPVAAFAGSFCAQTHISYVALTV